MKKNKGAIAIFVKTPGHSPIKTRLIQSLLENSNQSPKKTHLFVSQFYLFCIKTVEKIVKKACKLNPKLIPYWAVAEKNAMQNKLWRGFSKISQGSGSLGERLSLVYQELIRKHDFVLLIGADCPHLESQDLLRAAQALQDSKKYVIGKTKDGGFYLFGAGFEISKKIWTSVPYSQGNTALCLEKNLKGLAHVFYLPQRFDIDTAEDLEKLYSAKGH